MRYTVSIEGADLEVGNRVNVRYMHETVNAVDELCVHVLSTKSCLYLMKEKLRTASAGTPVITIVRKMPLETCILPLSSRVFNTVEVQPKGMNSFFCSLGQTISTASIVALVDKVDKTKVA